MFKNQNLTDVWSFHKQLSVGLKIGSEEDPRRHRPGRELQLREKDSLLRDSISQEENHHDKEKVHQINSLTEKKTLSLCNARHKL